MVLNWKNITILQRLKADETAAPDTPNGPAGSAGVSHDLVLDTCLRSVIVAPGPMALRLGWTRFHGTEAYEFLVRLGAGLESELFGETEIQSQMRAAFVHRLENDAERRKVWGSYFQKIFEDIKEIRTHFLQNHGGQSYGTIARKLAQPSDGESVVILGAGALAESVIPYFSGFSLTVCNRNSERLEKLREKFQVPEYAHVRWTADTGETATALKTHHHMIACVPDSVSDDARVELRRLAEASLARSSHLHLGVHAKAEAGAWATLSNAKFLSDVFAERSRGDEVRTEAAKRARMACLEKARFRILQAHANDHSGWEELYAWPHDFA